MNISTPTGQNNVNTSTRPEMPATQTPPARPATGRTFSQSHLLAPASPAATSPPEQDGHPPVVRPFIGMGMFDRQVFTPAFAAAHQSARQALDSPENRAHLARTGELSPAAAEALGKFVSLVTTKSASARSTDAARHAFGEGPLTPAEKNAWMAFISTIPPTAALAFNPSGQWRPVTQTEIHQAFSREPGFAPFLGEPNGQQFVRELTRAVNDRSKEMNFTDQGMALTMRFGNTYHSTAHLIVASLWRDPDGDLKLGLVHQESTPTREAHWIGVNYDTIDTSASYPMKVAPSVESIRLEGMPSVNVFPCPNPQAIKCAYEPIKGMENAQFYAPTDTWFGNKPPSGPVGKAPNETCFNVTHKVLAQLYNLNAEHKEGLPHIFNSLRPFTSVRDDEFREIEVKEPTGSMRIPLDDIGKNEQRIQVKMFKHIGPRWGLSMPWDVQNTSRSDYISMKLAPGQVGITLPGTVEHFRFTAPTSEFVKGLTLDGAPVSSYRAYSRDEASRMAYEGNQAQTVEIAAVTRGAAKL